MNHLNNSGNMGGNMDRNMDRNMGRNNNENKDGNGLYIYGLIIYIIIFIIIIPYFIYKFKLYLFLQLYFVNTDLLASIISFQGGPFNSNIFKYLYNDTKPLIGYISYNIINLFVLLGIAYIIINFSKEKKSMSYGLAAGFFTYILTYLFPSRFIVGLMDNFDKYLIHFPGIKDKYNSNFIWFFTCLVGFVFALLFILIEQLCIKHFASYLASFIDKIVFKL